MVFIGPGQFHGQGKIRIVLLLAAGVEEALHVSLFPNGGNPQNSLLHPDMRFYILRGCQGINQKSPQSSQQPAPCSLFNFGQTILCSQSDHST